MKTLYIMVGAPASGKTYFAKHNLMNGPGWMYVSRDDIRFSLVKDDEEYFSHEKEVFLTYVREICRALRSDSIYNVIADATHLHWPSRKKLIEAIKFYMGNEMKEIQLIPVMMWTHWDTIEERNALRHGREVVPRDVLRDMYKKLRDPDSDPFSYTAIMYNVEEC